MLILGQRFLEKWQGRIINIHPSLLPSFRGLHPQRQALEAGVRHTGCTVHFVTNQLDGGPIICQEALEIQENDSIESLSQRLLPIEHRTYVRAILQLAQTPNEFPLKVHSGRP